MRARRLSVMAVGALAVLGAAPYAAVSAQAATAPPIASPTATPEPATELIVEGQAGDLVTNGFTGVETGSAYALQGFAADNDTRTIPASSDIDFQSIHNGDLNDPTSFGFAFDMPNGQQWAVGQTYTNTEGIVYGGGTQPWFYFSQFNTGPCGRPSTVVGAEDDKGTVKIDDLTWTNGVNSQVASMEVEFTQSCHGGPVTRGLFRYNETGPLPPGAPTGRPLPAGQGTVEPLTFRRGTSIISAPNGAVDGQQIATVSSESEGRTAYNPLGTRLLYSSDPGLSTVHPDGTHAAPLTETPGITTKDTEPAETWDGSVVVFVQGDGNGVANLASENTDGTTAGRAYHVPVSGACQQEHSPSFGADGTLIYECDNGGTHATYRFGDDGAALIPNSSQPAFSTYGSKIAFVRPDSGGVPQIFTANPDGTGITQVSQDPNGASKPAWSPDDKYLAYVNTAFHEIVEIPAGGGAPVGSVPNADDPDWTPPVTDSQVVREAGADRIGTAIAASQLNFANHGAVDPARSQARSVVLARSDNFADALGGSALAVREGAPLLTTASAGLNPAVRAEIGRVLAPGGTVYLLGGTQALSPAVASALAGYHVVRLAGDTRYGTAVAIAKAITPHPDTVMIATGALFPDALAAGATGEPVLLTNGAAMPPETAAYLNTLNPDPQAAGGTELITVGGPGDTALISAYQAGKLSHWPSEISRLKLAGPDRYTTALMVAQAFFTSDTNVALATGASWPDALSGGAMIGRRGGPLLLTAPTGISPAVLSYLSQESPSLYELFMMGGPAALPDAIGRQAASVIGVPGHVRFSGVYGTAHPAGAKAAAGVGSKSGADDSFTSRKAVGDLSPVSR